MLPWLGVIIVLGVAMCDGLGPFGCLVLGG